MAKDKGSKGYKPTSGMAAAARRALAWHEKGERGGTAVGLARANQLASGETLSESTVMRMFSFFSRHEVDKKAKGFRAGEEGYPSPGRVAWDMWGGDAGYSWSRKQANKIKNKRLKKAFKEAIKKAIGNSSSVNEVPYNASHAEYYERSSDYIEQRIKEGGTHNMTNPNTTEPDPTGDIAVTKAVDSDLAHRKINKAIKALNKAIVNLETGKVERRVAKAIKTLEKAASSFPSVTRADSVSVSNETGPVDKALTPDTSRADSVSVSNETGPVDKGIVNDADADTQGTNKKVSGDGDNSEVANTTVDSDAKPMTKASTCPDCGEDFDGEKCMKCMGKDVSQSAAPSNPVAMADDADDDDKVEKADDADDDEDDTVQKADTCPDCGNSPCTCEDKVYKSAQDLINDAKLSKSVWGGAFGSPNIPRVK